MCISTITPMVAHPSNPDAGSTPSPNAGCVMPNAASSPPPDLFSSFNSRLAQAKAQALACLLDICRNADAQSSPQDIRRAATVILRCTPLRDPSTPPPPRRQAAPPVPPVPTAPDSSRLTAPTPPDPQHAARDSLSAAPVSIDPAHAHAVPDAVEQAAADASDTEPLNFEPPTTETNAEAEAVAAADADADAPIRDPFRPAFDAGLLRLSGFTEAFAPAHVHRPLAAPA